MTTPVTEPQLREQVIEYAGYWATMEGLDALARDLAQDGRRLTGQELIEIGDCAEAWTYEDSEPSLARLIEIARPFSHLL